MRRAAMLVFCLLTVAFAAPAFAQLSGGLDGRWARHVVHLVGGGLAVPVADVWVSEGEHPEMVWRSRAPLDRADLGRPMLIERVEDAAPPLLTSEGGEASAAVQQAEVQRAKVLTASKDAHAAHLWVRDGIADALVELRLTPGCAVGCAIDGIALTLLPGSVFVARWSAPKALDAVDVFPLMAGDVQLGK